MSKELNIRDVRRTINRKDFDGAKRGFEEINSTKWDVLNKNIVFWGQQIPDRIKEAFYLELSTLLNAGVDIRSGLELIVEEQSKKQYKQAFGKIYELVIAGATLSSALEANSAFTPYEYHSIKIGEETGKLNFILNELASFFRNKIKQRQQIVGALTYPALVIIMAVLAVSFMVMYVVPMFADVFKRFGGQLPFITRAVLYFASGVKEIFGISVLIICVIAIFFFVNRKKKWFRSGLSSAILRIPLIGEITRKIYLSRFASTMALLVESKIPLVQGIGLVKEMIGYYPIEFSLQNVEERIMGGSSLHKALEFHKIYPKKMISLLKAGEEVNKTGLFFLKIAEQYTSEVEYQTTLLSKFLEPFIIIVLGTVVGIILIAMYLPLFKVGQSL